MDNSQLKELAVAIRRVIEGARDIPGSDYVKVERVDFDRLNQLAADLP